MKNRDNIGGSVAILIFSFIFEKQFVKFYWLRFDFSDFSFSPSHPRKETVVDLVGKRAQLKSFLHLKKKEEMNFEILLIKIWFFEFPSSFLKKKG